MFEFITDLFSSKPPALDQEAAPPPPPPPVQAPAPPKPKEEGEDPNAAPKKPVDQKKMDDAANTIFKKMDGWWVGESDKHAILDTLRGKSPDEVKAIKASYSDHFPGHDMDADLGKNLEGKDLDEAKASLSGDPVTAAVTALKSAESGTLFGNVDTDRVKDILNNIQDPKQRQAVAKQVGGELTDLLEGDDKEMTKAYLENDNAKVQAYKLKESMHGGLFGGGGFLGLGVGQDKEAMYKAIEDCKDGPERQKMMDAYKEATHTELTDDFKENLEGAEKDVASNLIMGDKEGADAAKMKASTEHWFTDKDALYKTMEGKSDAERAQMTKKFNSMYNTPEKGEDATTMDALLDNNLSGLDHDKAEELKDHGKLDDAFALKYAMEGSFWTTDKDLIKKTLEGKSKDEIDTLFKDKPELKQEIENGTSGRDGFEIDELLKGEPKTPEEKIARAEERYEFERGSGSNMVSKGIMDFFSDKGALLDAQEARLDELSAKVKAGEDLTDEEKQRLDKITGYQQMDVKTYQESKDSVSNAAAGAAAIAAGAAATVLTAGMAAPAVAAIAAGASGAATIATKAIIQDAGYSKEELRNDVIMTGVNAATGGAMGALGAEGGALFNMAGKLADSEAAQQAIIQGVSGAVSSSVGGGVGAMTQGKSVEEIFKAAGTGALSGGVGGAVTGGIGGAMGSEAPEGMDVKNWGMLKGGVSGTIGAAAGNAVNPDAYKGDSAALLGNWLQAVGGGAVNGVAGGYAEGKAKAEAGHGEGGPHAEGSSPAEAVAAAESTEKSVLPPEAATSDAVQVRATPDLDPTRVPAPGELGNDGMVAVPVPPVGDLDAKPPTTVPELPPVSPVEAKTPPVPEAPPMPEVSPVEQKLPPAIPETVPTTQPVEAKTPPTAPEMPPMPEVSPIEQKLPPMVEPAPLPHVEAKTPPVPEITPTPVPETVPTTQPVEAKTPPTAPEMPPLPEVSPVEAKPPAAKIPEAPTTKVEEAPPKATASGEEAGKTPIEEKTQPEVKTEAHKVAKEAETSASASEETKAPPEEGKAPTEEKDAAGAGSKPPANDNAAAADKEGGGKLRAAGLDDAMSELHKTLPEGSPERQALEGMPGFGVGEREAKNPLVIEPGSGKEACQEQVKERMQGYEKAMQAQVDAAMGNEDVKGKLLEAFGPQLRGQLTYEESLKLLGLPPEQGGVKGTELDLIAHPENGVEIAKALRERAQAAADERLANLPEEQKEEYLRRSLQQEAHARAARLTTEDVYAGMEEQRQKLTDDTYKNGSEFTAPVDPGTGKAQIDPSTAKDSQEALKNAPKDQVVDFAVIGQGMGAAAAASTRQTAEGTHGAVISEGQDLWTRMGEMPFGQNLDQVETAGLAIAYGDLGRMSVDAQGQPIAQAPGGMSGMDQMLDPETGKPRPEFRYGSSAELALATAATLAESGVGMIEGKLVKTEIRPGDAADWPEGATSRMLIRREIPVEGSNPPSVKVQEQWVYSKGSNDVVAGAGDPRRFGPEFFADSNPAAAQAALDAPDADPKLKEIYEAAKKSAGDSPDAEKKALGAVQKELALRTQGMLEGRTEENGYQFDADTARVLSAEQQLEQLPSYRDPKTGELALPESIGENGIMVQSGGASAAWVASELAKRGVQVDWLAREATPRGMADQLRNFVGPVDPKTGLATNTSDPLAKLYNELAGMQSGYDSNISKQREMALQHASAAGGEEAIPVQPATAGDVEAGKAEFEGRRQGSFGDNEEGQKLQQQMADLHASKTEKMNEAMDILKARLDDPSATPEQKLLLENALRQINTQGSTVDSHGGAVLPRNWDTAGNSNIHMTKGDVVLIQPLGENMVRMYLSDGSFVDTARVITGMGQDTTSMKETLPGKPQDLQSIASPDGEQFGLQTPGGEFRYLGAAAAMLSIGNPGAAAKGYMDFLNQRSMSLPDINSQGVLVGMANVVGDRIVGAQIEATARKWADEQIAAAKQANGGTEPTPEQVAEIERQARVHAELAYAQQSGGDDVKSSLPESMGMTHGQVTKPDTPQVALDMVASRTKELQQGGMAEDEARRQAIAEVAEALAVQPKLPKEDENQTAGPGNAQ